MKILFFAQCADWTGRRELHLPLPPPSTVNSLFELIPALAEHRSILKVAVNGEFADFDTEVRHGDEVAFLPPFSGG